MPHTIYNLSICFYDYGNEKINLFSQVITFLPFTLTICEFFFFIFFSDLFTIIIIFMFYYLILITYIFSMYFKYRRPNDKCINNFISEYEFPDVNIFYIVGYLIIFTYTNILKKKKINKLKKQLKHNDAPNFYENFNYYKYIVLCVGLTFLINYFFYENDLIYMSHAIFTTLYTYIMILVLCYTFDLCFIDQLSLALNYLMEKFQKKFKKKKNKSFSV